MVLAIDIVPPEVSPKSLSRRIPVPNDTNPDEDGSPESVESKYREKVEARTASYENQFPFEWNSSHFWVKLEK